MPLRARKEKTEVRIFRREWREKKSENWQVQVVKREWTSSKRWYYKKKKKWWHWEKPEESTGMGITSQEKSCFPGVSPWAFLLDGGVMRLHRAAIFASGSAPSCPALQEHLQSRVGSLNFSALGTFCLVFLWQDPNILFQQRINLFVTVHPLNHHSDMWPKKCLSYNRVQQHLDHPGQLNKEGLDRQCSNSFRRGVSCPSQKPSSLP